MLPLQGVLPGWLLSVSLSLQRPRGLNTQQGLHPVLLSGLKSLPLSQFQFCLSDFFSFESLSTWGRKKEPRLVVPFQAKKEMSHQACVQGRGWDRGHARDLPSQDQLPGWDSPPPRVPAHCLPLVWNGCPFQILHQRAPGLFHVTCLVCG